jgi:cytochrome c
MRHKPGAIVLAASLILAACSKSGGSQSAPPAEPAAESAASAAPLTAAQKKALLANLPSAYQNADLDNGQAKFAICKSCHTTAQGAGPMTGPNLWGVFGRKAGTSPGFAYSDGLKASGITWNPEAIDKWIANPRAVVPGTKMTFLGMADPKDRVDLVAYLKTVTSAP